VSVSGVHVGVHTTYVMVPQILDPIYVFSISTIH